MNHPNAFRHFDTEPFDIDADGLVLTVSHKDIEPGDTYVAKRNTGWHLLTCRAVDMGLGCVYNNEGAYPYDLRECLTVEGGL